RAGCGRSWQGGPAGEERRKEVPFAERLAKGKERAADFLVSQQSDDGAWRSDTYGTFKDGTGLTPLALTALLAAAPGRTKAVARGAAHLSGMVKPGGKITAPSYGFDFALYTAALSVTALSHPRCPRHAEARDAWLKMLRERQLTEDLGWKPEDREYGGWGYSRDLPRKPRGGELILPHIESNLSATTFALEALRAAGVSQKDARLGKALVFVRRCQNWADDPRQREPAFAA